MALRFGPRGTGDAGAKLLNASAATAADKPGAPWYPGKALRRWGRAVGGKMAAQGDEL